MNITVNDLLPFYEHRKNRIAEDLNISPTAVTLWGGEPIPDNRLEEIKEKHPDWFTKKGTLKAWNNQAK